MECAESRAYDGLIAVAESVRDIQPGIRRAAEIALFKRGADVYGFDLVPMLAPAGGFQRRENACCVRTGCYRQA